MNYINIFNKKFVDNANILIKDKLSIDYATNNSYEFQLLNEKGNVVEIDKSKEYYLALSHSFDSALCAFSNSFSFNENSIVFVLDTYTQEFLENVKFINTPMFIEIGINDGENFYSVLLLDDVLAQPRVYALNSPPKPVTEYYSKEEAESIFLKKDETPLPPDVYSKIEIDDLLDEKANSNDVYTQTQTDELLNFKVNKVSGKQLSTNDFTNDDKIKLDSAITTFPIANQTTIGCVKIWAEDETLYISTEI